MTDSGETKEVFYSQLRNVVQSAHQNDKPLVVGDINARFGYNHGS